MLITQTDTFYPAPNIDCGVISIQHWGSRSAGWSALREEIATALGCDEDELTTSEIVWNDGDSWSEFVFRDGRVIGSIGVFADLITAEDWPAIFEAHRAPVDA